MQASVIFCSSGARTRAVQTPLFLQRTPAPTPPTTTHIYLPAVLRAETPRCAAFSSTSSFGGSSVAANNFNDASSPNEQGALDCDTIVAVVTGAQQGSVSIIRLSGIDAVATAAAVFRPAGSKFTTTASSPSDWDPESHRIYYGHAVDPADGSYLDEVLALVMLGPRSFTAEDVVEIHTHGGGVCAARVVRACLAAGARLARPGEFTLRAFLNGRLDLSQAESVSALVDARTVAAADAALAGLGGGLGREIQAARIECLDLLVEMDVRLDFDEDLPPLDVESMVARIVAVEAKVAAALATARTGQLLRSGLQVALVGRPNVGKSSLLNALSGTERAIVTEVAGTTRDVVEAGLVVGGIPITLLDTAGLRDAEDKVERIGVERSMAAARAADVVVFVVDAAAGWGAEDEAILDAVQGRTESLSPLMSSSASSSDGDPQQTSSPFRVLSPPPSLLVLNKCDLAGNSGHQNGCTPSSAADASEIPGSVVQSFSAVVQTSAATGAGLETFKDALLELAGAQELAPGGVAWAVNERQAEALTRAAEALIRVKYSVAGDLPVDFWTIDLRGAVLALGEVSGEDVTEEVLDAVFSRFCIGK